MNVMHLTPESDLRNILLSLTEPTTIYLKNGVYNCKAEICADGVKIVGEDREKTVISYGDYAKKRHADSKEYNTFRTYTLCVTGEGAALENLTVENTVASPEKSGQCVALSVNAGRFYAKNVDIRSTQDTLFTSPFPDDLVARYSGLVPEPLSGETYYDGFIPRRQLYAEGGHVQIYEHCRIYGNTDFIFGGAEAYFYRCKLVSVAEARGKGFVAAPCHPLRESRGYAFIDCDFVSGGADRASVFLARPWRDFGKCSFINCRLGEHVSPLLFDKWNDTYRDGTARFAFFNLGGEVAPVGWAKELDREQAYDIIKCFEERKREILEER